MTSNQGQPGDTVIPMPEIQRSKFIKANCEHFNSVLEQVKKKKQDRKKEDGSSSRRTKPLIQRVPQVLYDIKADFKKCFKPRLVSLGPLHHGDPKFKRAEQSKLIFAAIFSNENNTTCEILFDKVKAEIGELKNCYDSEEIKEYDDDKLAWMLFIDGCAVLCAVHYGMEGRFEELGTKPDLLVFAQHDLFLLENQIPYRVLRILIESVADRTRWEQSMTDFIAQNLITNIQGDQPKSRPAVEGKKDYAHLLEGKKDYAHLLERLRDELLTGAIEKNDSSRIGTMLLSCGNRRRHRKTFRSIKELTESGISVKPTKSNNIQNISFYCNIMGKLMMPRILVDDSTASKFLNLVALEMCRDFKNGFEVTTYLYFLDTLIDTAEDVKELRVAGMLHNYFGSDEEVADLFNKLSKDLVPDQQGYFDVTENIHKYCNNPWTSTLSHLYYTYFSTPWSIMAFLGAIAGLLFSATQAYFASFK